MENKKSLIIYFSHTGQNWMKNGLENIDKGNTEIVAEKIQALTGADMFKVETVKEYPFDYYDCCAVAKQELKDDARPKLVRSIESISEYDTIYIGTPIWYGHVAMAIFSAIEGLDFSGKNIKLFVTHEGSGLGNCPDDIAKLCATGNIKRAIAIRGSSASESDDIIKEWVEE